ncbi:uncharacterized protein PITG_10651 [Phytophthora infestans T30-4]|uniref:Uncharacterized protein n=1 Tax=Phytophthora infestans (strain T30-4) TaxID=403677 RepID=D0NGS2_PHYIT|nr:uncharacterized protein PITG_10651 [Phytophthora infestans T30-4]EEY58561.1 conserved hypothetical protein [Phytophthora infestans T30-4]|eukprot:XP_002901505.1 conserved hypothetical protein [Phytophthora infestans T30-4]
MSFLDRFQGKNATVTAQGHLKKADGSEEIRVGPPKRRPPQQQQKSSQQRPVENNNSPYDGQTMLRQPAKIQVPQNSPKECRSPREINESRVVTEQDQLAFSRKARTVQYEPCKLAQYKKEKPDGYYELGKLQPDLNTDELVEKRAKNDRIKAFSQNLRTINKNTQSKKPVDATKEQLANAKPRSSREKGLAFAKRVPKPRLSQRSDSAEGELPTVKARAQRSQMSKPKNPNVVLDDDSRRRA